MGDVGLRVVSRAVAAAAAAVLAAVAATAGPVSTTAAAPAAATVAAPTLRLVDAADTPGKLDLRSVRLSQSGGSLALTFR